MRPLSFASQTGGGKKNGSNNKKEKLMSAKEVCLIVIIALITIGGFIFLAPEYEKKAQLMATLEQNQMMIDNLHSDIEHKRITISKLDKGDPATIARILRERFGLCSPNENIFKFKGNGNKVQNAD